MQVKGTHYLDIIDGQRKSALHSGPISNIKNLLKAEKMG